VYHVVSNHHTQNGCGPSSFCIKILPRGRKHDANHRLVPRSWMRGASSPSYIFVFMILNCAGQFFSGNLPNSAHYVWNCSILIQILRTMLLWQDPGECSRYSDWLRAGRRRSRSSSHGRVQNFHISMSSRQDLGPIQLPIQWVPGAFSPEVKRAWRRADHSPPTSAEVKKTCVYTSTPPYVFMA
jgi:hypothetical protein